MIVGLSTPKVKILGSEKDIVACQGREDEIAEFEAWWEADRSDELRPELTEEGNFAALILQRDGRILKVYERLTIVAVPDDVPFMALGSGDQLAAGAMAFGASPREAIEIACRYDCYTGGPVQYERI